MPTSYDFDMHFLAKKAKNRLSGHNERADEYNKYTQRDKEIYSMILTMATQEETVYNPMSRFVGKDLTSIPDSSEKVRTVLETSQHVDEIRKRVRYDLIKKDRNHEFITVDGKDYNPLDLLCKLH